MKKAICFIISLVLVFSCVSTVSAADVSKIEDYKKLFADGEGPETNGTTIDYVYYTPENMKQGEKYPLVIYIHGMGQGDSKRAQIRENNFPLWASEELQSRFVGTEGAYLFVPRSHEDKLQFWPDSFIEPLKAAIDSFIAEHADTIDLTRIYIGGFSMGGKMTIKMLASYPDFFAAAFPMCPAYQPTDEELEAIADIPLWLIVSKYDVLAGYFTSSQDIWERFCEKTNVPDDCRLSLFGTVRFPDGKKTTSNHHVWFAVANDMFTYEGGDYYNMTTTTAAGDEVTLTYPDGIINWLSSYTSDYDGSELTATGLPQKNTKSDSTMVLRVLKSLFAILMDVFKSSFC